MVDVHNQNGQKAIKTATIHKIATSILFPLTYSSHHNHNKLAEQKYQSLLALLEEEVFFVFIKVFYYKLECKCKASVLSDENPLSLSFFYEKHKQMQEVIHN